MNRSIFFFLFIIFLHGAASSKDHVRILSKNVSLAAQLNEDNTKYIIKEDLIIDRDVTLPKNCILKIDGGSINGPYTLCGQHTQIAAGLSSIFGSGIRLAGTWNNTEIYPEWFGAIGDGKTDDTEAIRKAIWFAVGKKLVFQHKTYIINVTAGKDVNTQRVIFPDCKCVAIYGDSSIIKLGNNDNCNLYKNKGFGAIFSIYTIDSCHVKGIVFDYNYDNNPIFQTQGIRQDVQENTQLNAFQFRRVRKVTIEDCTVIGHSGTNCIDYNDARYDVGDKVFEVTIQRCKFLKSGGKSYYRKANSYVDAFHDCSTIALHYCGNNHDTPFIVNVNNNYFEGVGGNAYNVIETDASKLNFSGNTINKYVSCIFPCVGIYDGDITIRDNHFIDVSRGVVLWLRGGTDEDSYRYGYQTLNITNNECVINMGLWLKQDRYDNIGSNISKRYGFIFTTFGNNKSVKEMSIIGNSIRYVNTDGVSPELCTKASINFETAGSTVSMMRCGKMMVSHNSFYNAVNRILHNSMFQEIDSLMFNHNLIYKPFSVQSANTKDGGGVIYLNHSRAYAPSLSYPTIFNFIATNNKIIYDGYTRFDGCAAIVNSEIRGNTFFPKNSLIIKGNSCTSYPQYGNVRFIYQNDLFGNVELEDLDVK